MKAVLIATSLLLITGCTAEVGRKMAEDECYQIQNNVDREQCFKDVKRTFKNY
ncbi:hypothetical protein [Grimontia marina]|uniref:Lipoprotein n=1 Tax=Grimontia marina TaxID=646534 RepID=A0A128FAQ1_9GAMM|nr:hypothetical protein [Grimontia marina]CZF83585.1 hypothetical protein GMA8713_02725 [Grimontia marina]